MKPLVSVPNKCPNAIPTNRVGGYGTFHLSTACLEAGSGRVAIRADTTLCCNQFFRYGQLPRTVKSGPSSIAGEPFCDLGTVTLAVAVPTLPEASVAWKVIV